MITIEKYNHKMLNIWDDFIYHSNNGTIFHTRKFLGYHIERCFTDFSLMFYFRNKLVCVLPAAVTQKDLFSHPGASFGGLIIKEKTSFQVSQKIIKSLIDYCKQKFNSIIIINTPSIYNNVFDESLNYLLLLNNFKYHENYISHFVKINKCSNVSSLLNKRKKRYVEGLIKNKQFLISPSSNLEEFYKILLESKLSFGIKPTHSLAELKKLINVFPQHIKLFLSKDGDIVVGGVLVVYTSPKTCLVFYNAIKNKYKKSQLAALQLYFCMQQAQRDNISIVDFGVSHEPQKKNPLSPKASLIQFKEQFGAHGVSRNIYKRLLSDK